MRWMSRLITAVVIVTLLIVVGLLVRSKVPDPRVGGSFRTYAMFHDGSRLQPGSPVIIAGVRVGDITGLSIEGRLARVDMRLQDDVRLPAETTFATRKSSSLFGDSYLEIIPGPDFEGVVYLKSGEPIPHVEEGASTDRMMRTIVRALPKIDNALDKVHDVVVEGRPFVQGPVRQSLEDADRWLAEGRIESPLSKANQALERLERGSTALADAMATDGRAFPDRIARWNARIVDARKAMADANVRIVQSMSDAREGMNRVDDALDQAAEYLGAIDEGRGDGWRGTLGTLVNDPQLGDDIEDATAGLRDATSSFDRFKAWLGGRFELNFKSGEFRVYAIAEIWARNDKFYLIELERSSLGIHEDSLIDAPNTGAYTRREVIGNSNRFTLQFGKRFGWYQLRAGIKESTFGAGADLLLFDRLKLSADVFGSWYYPPRIKLAAQLAVYKSLYILGGIDDALNPHDQLPIVTGNTEVPQIYETVHYGRDYFVGAALHFSDEDLATLLRLYGALLVGLL